MNTDSTASTTSTTTVYVATTSMTVTTATGGIAFAYDYGSYFARIATSLESISDNLQTITALTTSTGSGIRVTAPYDWTNGIDLYNWYITQGNALTTGTSTSASFTSLLTAIESITTDLPKFK